MDPRFAGPKRTFVNGPIPSEDFGVGMAVRKVPSPAWQTAHPPGSTDEQPTDADWILEVVLIGTLTYPSALKPVEEWDRGMFQITQIASVPYLAWKGLADAEIRHRRGEAEPTGILPVTE
jgi:hypothetical protein